MNSFAARFICSVSLVLGLSLAVPAQQQQPHQAQALNNASVVKLAIDGKRSGLALRECNADAIISAAKEAVKKLEDECVPA